MLGFYIDDFPFALPYFSQIFVVALAVSVSAPVSVLVLFSAVPFSVPPEFFIFPPLPTKTSSSSKPFLVIKIVHEKNFSVFLLRAPTLMRQYGNLWGHPNC